MPKIPCTCQQCGAIFLRWPSNIAGGRSKCCSRACAADAHRCDVVRPDPGAIPYGLCGCGCGQKTRICTHTDKRDGEFKGEPLRYINGHNGRVYMTPQERFKQHLRQSGTCLLWTANTNGAYGVFHIGRQRRLAHKVAWEFAHGPVPRGMQVGHNCPGGDNKLCCNEEHLLLLTPKQHGADRIAKDQQLSGDRHPAHLHPERMRHGEDAPWAKLTADQVTTIRTRYMQGRTGQGHRITQVALAREYGVSEGSIESIVLRKNWKHVP